MHPRKAIRAAFKDRLTNATAAQDRVFDTMTPPIQIEDVLAQEGPVIMVYVRHEDEREEDYPVERTDGAFRRRIDVTIEALATGANVDDTLDDIAETIEGLIENWSIPGFPAVDPLLMNSQIDTADTGDRIIGGLFMTYHLKAWSSYRKDTSDGFLPTKVYSVPQGVEGPDLIVDPSQGIGA